MYFLFGVVISNLIDNVSICSDADLVISFHSVHIYLYKYGDFHFVVVFE